MKKETKKAPTIRFRGFTDDWEQRKLGEIFTERSEKKHEYLPPLTIIQGCGTVRRDEMDRELIYDKSSLSNYKLVKKNDFIVHLRSFEGGLEKSNIEGIVSPAYHIFHGEKINTEFYYSFFRSNDFINHKLVPFVYGIRDGRSIDIAGMKTIKIPYPSVNEQNHIGTLIGQLNSLIALHQRKLAQLKKLKKYFLQNMFPAKGEKVPRIRFKGFTGDWEQRKFKNEVKISNEMVDPKTGLFDELIHIGPGDIEPYTGQLVSEIKTVKESDLISGKFHFYKGDIIYSKIRPELSKCVIAPEDGLASADAYVLHGNENICQKFLYCILQTRSFYSYSTSVSMRTGMPKINREELGSYDFYAPSIKEQRTIGDFLIGLGKLITLHQRKLDQLQMMKKFMLQNIFI